MKEPIRPPNQRVRLKDLAKHLGLTSGTVSAVLNKSPYAKAIPEATKQRILEAARELKYRPHYFAKTLRSKQTYTIGIVAARIGDPYGSLLIGGIQEILSERGYLFLAASHRHNKAAVQDCCDLLEMRGVEGLIVIDTCLTHAPSIPAVAIGGSIPLKGVTNIVLDHSRAAHLALSHLYDLGHRNIAVIRGPMFSVDSGARWDSLQAISQQLGIRIRLELTVALDDDDISPDSGYRATMKLIARGEHFSAVLAYNDLAAIGASRALREAKLEVPRCVSVVGFDDIREAAYQVPSLTTIRQPMHKMGATAAQILLACLGGAHVAPEVVRIEPELIVRDSTAPPDRI
jgi:LacI family transcriptional regulator